MGHTSDANEASAASLTSTVLDEEAARLAAQQQAAEDPLIVTEELPGVGAETMTLRQGLAKGGLATFIVLLILNSLDELELAAITVLAPDIRDTFGVSNGTIVFIASASASFFVLGAMPMGYLADRYKRAPIIGIASLFFSFFVFLSGLAVNVFMLFWARFGVGIAKANTITVHGSLIADTYPIGIRGRMGALNTMTGRAVGVASPVLVGGIAAIAGGSKDGDGPTCYSAFRLPCSRSWPSDCPSPSGVSGRNVTSWAPWPTKRIQSRRPSKQRSPGCGRSRR